MSDNCFNIKIEEPSRNILHIENSVGDSTKNIDIIQSGLYNIEVSPCMAMLPSDFETVVDAEISSFISAGSGINITSSISGIIINVLPVTSGNFQFLTVNGVDVSLSGHTHVINDIADLQTALDNKQPSGIYASGIHYHISSDITNFNTSVSGLLPVKDITSGSGINVTNTSGIFNVAVTGQFGLTGEQVDDRVSNLLSSGYGISLNYDDNNDLLTISTIGLQPSGNYSIVGHTHLSSDITDFNSSVSGLLPQSFDAAVPWTANHTLADGTRYLVNDLVYESGRLYKANYENESIHVSDPLYWTDVGPGYRLNIDGRDIPNIPYPVDSVNGQTGDVEISTTDIDDFATGVSGLLPTQTFTSLSGVSGVLVTNVGTDYIVSLSDPSIQLSQITDLSNEARTFLLVPSSVNLQSLVNDETGSGLLVFNNSPSFVGIPTVPTAASGTNNGQIASTQFVRTEIANLVDSAPATLDTLNELAAALGDDANFSTTVTNSLAGKANLSGAIFTGPVTIPSGTGNFNTLTVNNIGVSVSGHTHTYSDITNFASGVSDSLTTTLLAGSFIVLDYNSALDTLTISTSGLQPSGNYSVVGHTHTASNITDFNSSVSGLLPVKNISGSGYVNVSSVSGNYTVSVSGLQPSGSYSLTGHTHTSSDITNFNSSVSGLLPSVSGSGYVNSSFANNIYTISVSGLQPSGNYSLVGHTHTSSDITNFNSSVSGLLPVKNIIGGSGILVGSTSGDYTITAFGVAAASASSLVTEAYNSTGATIPKMSVVYINGGNGNLPTIQLGIANGEAGSSKTYAITAEQILHNHSGDVVVLGALIDVNTAQFGATEGALLYLSPTTSGAITTTKPLAPNHMVSIGKIVRNHVNQGVIEVSIQNGFELYELHDVDASGATAGQFLQRNGGGYWVPSSSGNFSTLQVNGTGVSLSGHTHTASNITDFNSSVSGLLPVTSIIGGTNISVVPSGSQYTISVSGSLGLTTEEVDDRVSNLLVAGSGISLDYNDGLDTLTIHNTSISPDEIEEYTATVNFPASGNVNILYRTTDDGRLYQWSGSFYAEIGPDSVTTGSHASQHYTNGIDPILNVVSRPATLTATVNNYAHNNADIIYLNADANRVITGLIAATDGTVKLLVNRSLYTITLDHQDTNSNPENRFMVPFGSDYILQAGYGITVVYDSDALRWRVLT